jgi:hypothetical protein
MTLLYVVSREHNTALDGIAYNDKKIFCSGGARAEAQQFIFIPTGDGYYRITHKTSGKELACYDSHNVLLASTEHTNHQHHWKFDIPIEGYQRIINRTTGFVLDSTETGELFCRTWNGATSQMWRFINAEPGARLTSSQSFRKNPNCESFRLNPNNASLSQNSHSESFRRNTNNASFRKTQPASKPVKDDISEGNTKEAVCCCASLSALFCCFGTCFAALLGMQVAESS